MSEDQAPPPLPELPHGEAITLDLVDGFRGYCEAMEAVLNRIKAAGYPGDARQTANTMLFEIFNYLEGLLPGIDVREVAAFYGSVVGLGVGGYIATGELEEGFTDYVAAVFYSAMANTIPKTIEMHKASEQADETGLLGPDGEPVASIGPVVSRIVPGKKRHGGKKRKKRKKR